MCVAAITCRRVLGPVLFLFLLAATASAQEATLVGVSFDVDQVGVLESGWGEDHGHSTGSLPV